MGMHFLRYGGYFFSHTHVVNNFQHSQLLVVEISLAHSRATSKSFSLLNVIATALYAHLHHLSMQQEWYN